MQQGAPIACTAGNPTQAEASGKNAANYPLELDFLWGRGAKETPVGDVDWSIRNVAGAEVLHGNSNGPEVVASLPDGRYTVTAEYDGSSVSHDIDLHNGAHNTVVLEWPQ